MQDNQSGQTRPSRESIWSIPRHLRRWYAGVFILQYFSFLGLTIWEKVQQQQLGEDLAEMVLTANRGMGPHIPNIVASAYVIVEGIMLAEWLREWDQRRVERAEERGVEKGRGEGLEEGLEKGRDAERQLWEAWYERHQTALREGKPFDEPPPSGPASDANSRNGQ